MSRTGHIQIDDPTFCYFCNENMIAGMEKAGVDHEALLDTYIRAINVCTQGRPNDLTIGVHMCRGNFKVGIPPTTFLFAYHAMLRVECIFQKVVTTASPSSCSTPST